jgi:hypothetical protein
VVFRKIYLHESIFCDKNYQKKHIITWTVLLLTLNCTATVVIRVRDHLETAIYNQRYTDIINFLFLKFQKAYII